MPLLLAAVLLVVWLMPTTTVELSPVRVSFEVGSVDAATPPFIEVHTRQYSRRLDVEVPPRTTPDTPATVTVASNDLSVGNLSQEKCTELYRYALHLLAERQPMPPALPGIPDALHEALAAGDCDAVQAMLSENPELVKACDGNGNLAVNFLSPYVCPELGDEQRHRMLLLLFKSGVDPVERPQFAQTPNEAALSALDMLVVDYPDELQRLRDEGIELPEPVLEFRVQELQVDILRAAALCKARPALLPQCAPFGNTLSDFALYAPNDNELTEPARKAARELAEKWGELRIEN